VGGGVEVVELVEVEVEVEVEDEGEALVVVVDVVVATISCWVLAQPPSQNPIPQTTNPEQITITNDQAQKLGLCMLN
jgi:hypothetical protein